LHSLEVERESLEQGDRAMKARIRILELADPGHPLPEILREICVIVMLNDEITGTPWLVGPSPPPPLTQALTQSMRNVQRTTAANLDLRARWRQALAIVSKLLPSIGYNLMRIAPFASPGTVTPAGIVALLHDRRSISDTRGARSLTLARPWSIWP
jgi:hypothetical protein